MPAFIDLSNTTSGLLTVIRRVPSNKRGTYWLCECRCGNQVIVNASSLRNNENGRGTSCGCTKSARLSIAKTKHGHCGTGIYRVWASMIERCTKEDRHDFQYYGGRGVQVCTFWQSFANFLADMGERPHGLWIDRIETNGHYSCGHCEECIQNNWPANCRWATPIEQQRNKRNTRYLTVDGVTRCIAEWEEISGISSNVINWRINKGWTPHDAITIEPRG